MLDLNLWEASMPLVIFSSGFLARTFISGRKNEMLFLAVIKLIESLLEKFEVCVPEFLQELLEEMQKLPEETENLECIIEEEIKTLIDG